MRPRRLRHLSRSLDRHPLGCSIGLQYLPLAHPGFLPKRDTKVVPYSRNRTNLDEVTEDPMRYRPRFLRVRLP